MKNDITLKELKEVTGIKSNLDLMACIARLHVLESEKMANGGYNEAAGYYWNKFNELYDYLWSKGYYKISK